MLMSRLPEGVMYVLTCESLLLGRSVSLLSLPTCDNVTCQ